MRMKLLVGYDGSNSAKEAIEVAKMHAKAFGATVSVVRSLGEVKGDQGVKVAQAEKELESVKSRFDDASIKCQTHLLIRGMTPGEDLVKFADENNVDEIVIGVKRRSKMGKILFGSNAQFIILKATCPVVTVK